MVGQGPALAAVTAAVTSGVAPFAEAASTMNERTASAHDWAAIHRAAIALTRAREDFNFILPFSQMFEHVATMDGIPIGEFPGRESI